MADIVSRIYSNFRGVDFRGEEVNLVRSPDSVNMWKDYRETESIQTRPGLELHTAFDSGANIYGIFFFRGVMLVHHGTKLYKVSNGVKTEIYSGLNEHPSDSFVYKNVFYFKDGLHYLKYDGITVEDVVGYVPTTSICRKPSGSGTTHEDFNMLTGRRINTFLSDDISFDYYLDAQGIDDDFVPIVKVNDVTLAKTEYAVDYQKGMVTFSKLPINSLQNGQDNVSIEYRKTVTKYSDLIQRCTLLQVFDNRVFFSGNPSYPNVVWHCSLNDPSYCSDSDYYNEGMDEAPITGLVAGNNALWVFRKGSDANTNVFYHTPTLDDDYGKIYPSSHSSVSIGCIGKAINFNDDIVFFSARGMEGISGDVTTEQVAAHRSSLVDRKLIAEDDYQNMLLAEWEGYLFVFIGKHVYLADSRAKFTNGDHIEYEWFYWELPNSVNAVKVQDNKLYLACGHELYTFSDETTDNAIASYWVTPKDKFKNPHKLKTTNKRGCVVEATGDIAVFAKVEDADFEFIGAYESVADFSVSRIKQKKFKDLQLMFYSKTKFSLETVTLECFIGGYIKQASNVTNSGNVIPGMIPKDYGKITYDQNKTIIIT